MRPTAPPSRRLSSEVSRSAQYASGPPVRHIVEQVATGQPIVIVGAGGFGREVLDVVEAVNDREGRWEFLGFIDDGHVDDALLARRGTHRIGDSAALADLGAAYVLGIASPVARRALDEHCTAVGLEAAVLTHPQATLGGDNTFGEGLVMTAHAVVTTNVRLGRHVHLNLGATVGHDCVIGSYVTINPGANISGNVVLGDGVTIGTGAAVIQGRTIGAGTTVGAGAVVVTDLPPDVVAVGVPARPR